MKEYTLVIHEKENHVKIYLLTPLYKSVPEDEHYILFDDHDEAHQAKLSLALGTLAHPLDKNKNAYKVTNVFFNQCTTYRLIEKRDDTIAEDEALTSCCFSGCMGCPIYERKMRDSE